MNLDSFGGRRFLLTLGCGAATTLLCWYPKISDQVYATVIIATIGVYVAGNVTQKIKEGNNEPTN